MLQHIDKWLNVWAAWSVDSQGYPTTSPEYRMMTESAPLNKRYRRNANVLILNETIVVRHTEPMRCKETPSRRNVHRVVIKVRKDDEFCQLMQFAFEQLRYELRNPILVKYKYAPEDFNSNTKISNQDMADILRIGKTQFLESINLAHESIDTYLRLVNPMIYRKMMADSDGKEM